MDDKVKRTSLYAKIIAIALALVLWTYVTYGENPEMTRWYTNVPITVTGMAELAENQLSFVSMSGETVDVKVRARRSVLSKMTNKTITASLDLSKLKTAGENALTVSIRLPSDSASITDDRHTKITVTTEEIIEKAMSVSAILTGTPSADLAAVDPTVAPEEVVVRGPSSKVSAIRSLITEDYSVSGITRATSGEVGMIALDSEGATIEGITFTPPLVTVSFQLYLTAQLPITIPLVGENSDYDVTVEPVLETVALIGPPNLVRGMTEVRAEPLDISQFMTDATARVKLMLPDGVTQEDGKESVSVNIIVTPRETQEATTLEASEE